MIICNVIDYIVIFLIRYRAGSK